MPLDLSQQDILIQKHPEVLLSRSTISALLNHFVNLITPGLAGTAADPNGGQGGSDNLDTFSLAIKNSTIGTYTATSKRASKDESKIPKA